MPFFLFDFLVLDFGVCVVGVGASALPALGLGLLSEGGGVGVSDLSALDLLSLSLLFVGGGVGVSALSALGLGLLLIGGGLMLPSGVCGELLVFTGVRI